MRPKLLVKIHEARTLLWWINRRSNIDMDPPYQRHGRLWSPSDKSYLIDSIINGFDIPKFYMADFNYGDSPLNVNKLPYAIIDGKQRFESIFDFYDGTIVLNKDFEYLKNPSLRLNGLGYKDLKQNYPDVAEDFENANLTIMSVICDNEDLINDLFVRLNRSKPLTGAEIRNAMAGPAVGLIRKIAAHDFFATNINFSVKRMTDQDTAAKILYLEYYEKLLETKRRNLDDFVQTMKSMEKTKRDRLELAGRRALENLDNMVSIFLPKDSLLKTAGVVPVYYWFIRNLDSKYFSIVREFLIKTEEKRKLTQKLITDDPQQDDIDQELVQFNALYRSPNDATSLEGRFQILRRRFKKEIRL